MTTLTRTNSRSGPPVYKDYVNFLAGYKNGKKEDDTLDSVTPVRNFIRNTVPIQNTDATDHAKPACKSYDTYLETSKTNKFSSVHPKWEEKHTVKQKIETNEESQTMKPKIEAKEEKQTVKSEIFIEIQPAKPVSVVSKIFQPQQTKTESKTNTINSKISLFEKQNIEKKPKVSDKPVLSRFPQQKVEVKIQRPKDTTPPLKVVSPPPQEITVVESESTDLPPPPPLLEYTPVESLSNDLPPPPPPLPSAIAITKTNNSPLPPPPPPVIHTSPKIQASLTNGPQTKFSLNNTNGVVSNEIDRNNPLVKKLVYGTLRGLYGAYHDKASDMLATMPKNMVVRSNGVQDRIDQIAANGDLDKLNGRMNPKKEQE